MAGENFIRCHFCNWTTRKWGRGANTGKAFAKLAWHIAEEHHTEHKKIAAARADLETPDEDE